MTGPESMIYHYSEEVSPRPPVCATCRHQLVVIPEKGETTDLLSRAGIYVFRVIHLKESDHAPYPVAYNAIPDSDKVFVCDFCTSTPVRWSYPAVAFEIKAGPGEEEFAIQDWGSSDDWAACDKCHQLIEKDDWEAITERTLFHSPGISQLPEYLLPAARQRIEALHGKFRESRMGPPTEVDDG